jgi:4-diphosphocytidyl-2-C-methyl-D-erythritol kinase
MRFSEPAPAKLNLALHVRGKLPDGRHAIETIFAFCVDGDRVEAEESDRITLEVTGPFAASLRQANDNLVLRAANKLAEASGAKAGAALQLIKNLPVASGIGGGSADAAATLRLLTRLWNIDPSYAASVAPSLGSDVPACLLSLAARGEGAGDRLELIDPGLGGTPVLLVNPLVPLSTADVFAGWNGGDGGALGEWRDGRNDLEAPARALVPEIGDVLTWLESREGADIARMSGSGATCFALFDDEASRDRAVQACPSNWWHLATVLR